MPVFLRHTVHLNTPETESIPHHISCLPYRLRSFSQGKRIQFVCKILQLGIFLLCSSITVFCKLRYCRLVETVGTVLGNIRLYEDIHLLEVPLVRFITHKGNHLGKHLRHRLQILRTGIIILYIHTYYNVSPHTFGHIHRKIVYDSAIHKHLAVYLNWGKHTWYGHSCTHAQRKLTLVEHYLLAGRKICRNTGKRYGKTGKIHPLLIPH